MMYDVKNTTRDDSRSPASRATSAPSSQPRPSAEPSAAANESRNHHRDRSGCQCLTSLRFPDAERQNRTQTCGISGLLAQHPGILAAAALAGVDDQRAALERDAGQAAGDDGDLVAVEDVGAQVDVARLELVADEAGRAREADGGLGDVVAGVGLDLLGELARAPSAWTAGRSACRSRRIRRRP